MFRHAIKSSPSRGRRPTAALVLLLLVLLLVPLLAVGPWARAQVGSGQPVRVVATVGMIGDVAATVAGSCATVTTLMGPGVDPHLYQPTSGDVRTLQAADAILYAGHALEGQLGDVLDRFGQRTPTLAVAEAAVSDDDLIRSDDAYGVDPHAWMDVGLWAGVVPPIARLLTELAPGCAEPIRTRAAAYEAELGALDAWIRDAAATVPEERRVLITAHDAFGYFGRAYGFEVVGIQGISTEAEASVADIRAVTRRIVDAGIPAIFVETTINPRTVQAVLDAAADQGADVRLGGTLYADAMGPADTAAGSYLGMLHANTRRIVDALGGTPPPLPDALTEWAARSGPQD